jgi:uroporphyrinogen decarboxylase
MTKAERVRATIAGQETDRTPVSFWHHFPGQDRTIDGLVNATLDLQRQYDLDLVKLMPTGMYCVVDYGATIALREDEMGTTRLETSPIASPQDWGRLPPASPHQGELGAQAEVVRRVRAALGPNVPVIQTIFSPLTIAHKLAGDTLLKHLDGAEGSVREALERFAEDSIAFGRACFAAGANGVFFATRHASADAGLPEGVFQRLGVPYDLRVLEALAEDEDNWCTVLHLHGDEPFFDVADLYPVDAVSWHDRETGPPIREAAGRTARMMVAGINRMGAITRGDAEAAVVEIQDAIWQAEGRRLLVAPGCVLPGPWQEAAMAAVRLAVDEEASRWRARG